MTGIEFEVIWFDQEIMQYKVTCSNGTFCGATTMYMAHDDLSKAAALLNGFPSTPKDSRHITFGTFDHNTAGGGIDMAFECQDSVGHARIVVKLTTEQSKRTDQSQSVNLYIPIEANSIDLFVAEARSTNVVMGAKVTLHMTGHAASLS